MLLSITNMTASNLDTAYKSLAKLLPVPQRTEAVCACHTRVDKQVSNISVTSAISAKEWTMYKSGLVLFCYFFFSLYFCFSLKSVINGDRKHFKDQRTISETLIIMHIDENRLQMTVIGLKEHSQPYKRNTHTHTHIQIHVHTYTPTLIIVIIVLFRVEG